MVGIFGDFLAFPTKKSEARELLKEFGENSEQNSGQYSGRKFENFGELSLRSCGTRLELSAMDERQVS